jgi:hypothetical protein
MEMTMAETLTVEYRECVKCATMWKPIFSDFEDCPVCESPKSTQVAQVPEGLVAFNLTKEDLVTLSAICSYYKNTNAFPSQDGQRVAASVIERSRGY